MDHVCSACGEPNPAGAQFCGNCRAFLAWDESSTGTVLTPPSPRTARPDPAQPRTASPRDVTAPERTGRDARPEARLDPDPVRETAPPRDPAEGLFRIVSAPTATTVPATGEPADLVVAVLNTSQIVDGYLAAAPGGPGWLAVESQQVQLLPGSEAALPVRLRIVADTLVPAQQIPLVLRIRSSSRPTAQVDLPVLVDVPVVDVGVKVRAEPRLLRGRDRDKAECTLSVDNTGSNRRARVRFTGSDPEGAVQCRFEPPIVDVPPGGTGSVLLRMTAAPPDPGQEVTRLLTVAALDGPRSVETMVTWQQATSISAMTTLGVRIEPSVLRVRDADGATAQVVVDNRRGRSRVHAVLAGSDPERAMRLTFSPPVVEVDPGQVAVADLRVDSWRPKPGTEQTRAFTVTASNNESEASATGSLVQTTSRSAIETLTVRLEPSVLRLGNSRRAMVAAVLDNRGGAQPVHVTLTGDDPENAVRFRISPAVVDVPPGQQLSVNVALETPKAPVGRELTRPFSVVASDGHAEIPASGSIISSATSRRPLARVLFTLFGGLAIIIGGLTSLRDGLDVDGFDLMRVLSRSLGQHLDLNGFEGLVSADLLTAVLGVVAIFGLTGRSGRLTRLAVVLALLLVIGIVVALTMTGNGGLGGGAILAVMGCVAGYIGSKLVRR